MPPRILILDDDDHYALLFAAYLKLANVEGGMVEHAPSTQQAVEQLSRFTPDLVFLDNRVPPHADFRPGLKALRDAGYAGPVVVQSACVTDEVFDEAEKLGVAQVIDKFEMNEGLLVELLQKHAGATNREHPGVMAGFDQA
jgi:DNA-binding response OmpR family regulator